MKNRPRGRFLCRIFSLSVFMCFILPALAQSPTQPPKTLTTAEWWLVFFPIVVYSLAIIVGSIFLFKGENWRKVICEKRLLPHANGIEEYHLSLSRLALFLAGLTASLCAVACTSFFIYRSIADKVNPDMTSLAAIIAAVEIGGAIPYMANQFKRK